MKKATSYLIAQLVLDAIHSDPRKDRNPMPTGVLPRAKLWFDRLQKLKRVNRNYYASIAEMDFPGFLCSSEPNMAILDFWDGDVVKDKNGVSGIVKDISISPTVQGGGHAHVLYPDGKIKSVRWDDMDHATLPEEYLQLAKTMLKAECKCPFAGNDDEDE